MSEAHSDNTVETSRHDGNQPMFSVGGSFPVPESGRDVRNFNVGWRFFKGDTTDAERCDFNDSDWDPVDLPHGIELLPAQASGSVNYQGPVWYRKRFSITQDLRRRKLFLHFEGVMGKSQIWINGHLATEHYGGFLPIHIDISDLVSDGDNLIAVRADNSDDSTYPPGKPQEHLDWTYFGGIYRDVWLVATSDVYITNANARGMTAGGGVFARTVELTEQMARIHVLVDVANESGSLDCIVENRLIDPAGNLVATERTELDAERASVVEQYLTVNDPGCWSPEQPVLYNLETLVHVEDRVVDGRRTRIGLRTIDFRGREGFFLNGKPYGKKLIGGNRHQDFAYLGNALPNSMHYRDAKKLRDAGMTVIRSAHYPQDPSFMDACDELGLFVIVATPGWQFFSEEQIFQDRVCEDIRNMVRRDRNRPSVLIWECVLNEVRVTEAFAERVHRVTHEEYPFPGCFTAADAGMQDFNRRIYDVLYAGYDREFSDDKCHFQREWGDHVDDWSAHNSPSRASRDWGEAAQLVQAIHYANAEYPHPCWDTLCATPPQFVGGCLWHSFDHQRGYHPDPFWGGIMDAFRQPKYAYHLFEAQQEPDEAGPVVFIANEMTPFSSGDVWVFSNCDQVRLSAFGETVGTKTARNDKPGMRHPPVCFENVYKFNDLKARGGRKKCCTQELVAEGLIDGKVVATYRRTAAHRRTHIQLRLDDCDIPLVADGSDIVPIIAEVVDEHGSVKRLTKDSIRFEVEGQGRIVGDHRIGANPRVIEWGSAPVLVRSTTEAGPIKLRARLAFQGITTPAPAEIAFQSVAPTIGLMPQPRSGCKGKMAQEKQDERHA